MGYWELIDAHFKHNTLVSQHIDSYNQFIEERLPQLIEENNVIDPEVGQLVIEIKDYHL